MIESATAEGGGGGEALGQALAPFCVHYISLSRWEVKGQKTLSIPRVVAIRSTTDVTRLRHLENTVHIFTVFFFFLRVVDERQFTTLFHILKFDYWWTDDDVLHCRPRLEFYVQACAVDMVTKGCAGPPSVCRRAVLDILGTDLRTTCTCPVHQPDLAAMYDCLEWQRLLWLNPCVGKFQVLPTVLPAVSITNELKVKCNCFKFFDLACPHI